VQFFFVIRPEPLYTLYGSINTYILRYSNTIMVCTAYCNACGCETRRDNEGDSCPYHQQVLSDGTLLWDEFDQNGE